jgi:hypothetical protein
MVKLFTNEKETKRAIKAAVDQFRKILKKNRPTHCTVCGCTPKPDEWSHIAGICFDCI